MMTLALATGDPTVNATILRHRPNLAAIMKNGRFHERPTTTLH